jgi:predicted GNAT family acetyltransferase
MAGMDITVVDNPELNRFEALLPTGEVAGFATYQKSQARIVLLHTEVFDQYEGEGVGSTLARGALDLVRDSGTPLKVLCPFITKYIARHPEYADLVRT